jgi:hypothetical protein
LFLLLSFIESIKKAAFYLLENQSSASRPQPGAAHLVQILQGVVLPFLGHYGIPEGFLCGLAVPAGKRNCENFGKNVAGSPIRARSPSPSGKMPSVG